MRRDQTRKRPTVKVQKLRRIRILSLSFLLPGLAGLVISAMVSMHYMETLPRSPMPAELRMTPRNVDGVVVYQTVEENRRLDLMEYGSVAVFLVGLTLGLVYMRKWWIDYAIGSEDDDLIEE